MEPPARYTGIVLSSESISTRVAFLALAMVALARVDRRPAVAAVFITGMVEAQTARVPKRGKRQSQERQLGSSGGTEAVGWR